jgi:hypothetical protein
MEQSKGISGNNIVTVLMKDKSIDLQTASDHVGAYFKKLMDRYVDARVRMPSWGPEIDTSVTQYLEATAYWVRGSIE